MKKSINIGLILLLLFQACSTEENLSESINIESSTEETIINDSISIDKVSTENIVEELLAEFPQGIFYYLLKSEQVCLVEKAGSEVIRQMEKDLIEGNSTQEKYQEYFKACNIPPPDPGIGGRQPVAEGDNSPSEANQKQEQGNPVMQGTTLSSMHLSYLGSIRSLENNLGNIADPSLVQTNDGNLRVYFKNGNEPQAGISGYDNLIHSAMSSDGGRTWIVEAGVRVPVQSPIEALVIDGTVSAWGWKLSASGDSLVKYESSDGKNFQEVSIPRFVQSDCKDTDGNPFGPLGDPTITKLNDGSWIFHVQELVSPLGPFNRRACVATSNDGISWSVQIDRLYGGDIDVTTNPAIKLNRAGIVEWIWPTYDFMEYRKGPDGINWSEPEYLPPGGDPDFLDLTNGRQLLAFGNFSSRNGGVLIFTERIETKYTITSLNTGPTQAPTKKWLVEGANPADIKVVNICIDLDLSTAQGASVEIKNINNALEVTVVDNNEKFANPQCVYILVGPEQVMG
jgi:hypothetical protein